MSPDAGTPFRLILSLTRLGLGGWWGNGHQYVSWIHDRDLVRAVYWLLSHDDLSGPVNVASPGPLPQRDFIRELRRAARVPIGLPATRWMLEMGTFAMRTETELILKSRRVVPRRITESGFRFDVTDWSAAARDLVARSYPLRRLRRYVGSQVNTSVVRSRSWNDPARAGMPCSAMDSGVQPSPLWTERIGRGWLIRKISFLRTAKIWPLTSFAALGAAEVVHDHRRAVGGGEEGDVAADAAAGAGDDDHFLVEHASVHFGGLQVAGCQTAAMAAINRQPSRYSRTSTYSSTVWGLCCPAPRVTVGRPLAFR